MTIEQPLRYSLAPDWLKFRHGLKSTWLQRKISGMVEQGWAAEFFLDVCDFSKVKSFYDQMSGFDFCSFWKEGGETSTEKKYNGLLRH